MSLGAKKLRDWRKAQKPRVSQGALGGLLGTIDRAAAVSFNQVSRIERGECVPRLPFMVACQRLGICEIGDWARDSEAECERA